MADETKVEAPAFMEPAAPAPSSATPADAAPDGEINYGDLIQRLEQAGITEPRQLDGKLQAASERGHLANILGEVKSENAELRRMLSEMRAAQQAAPKRYADDDTANAGAIDLKDLVRSEMRTVLTEEKRQAIEAQQRAWQAWQAIQTDEDYHLVKDQWESKMRDPNFAIQLQAGTVNPVDAYRRLLRDHYKGAVRLAAETIKSLTKGTQVPKVHVEDSARVSADRRPEADETDKIKNNLRDKVNKGRHLSEDEELAALQAVLLGGGRR